MHCPVFLKPFMNEPVPNEEMEVIQIIQCKQKSVTGSNEESGAYFRTYHMNFTGTNAQWGEKILVVTVIVSIKV